MKEWKLTKPKLLISVTGGAQNFDVDKKLKKEFKRGLFNAASASNAWVITSGTDCGVMQWVGDTFGEALFTSDYVCFGIATYAMLANKQKFVTILFYMYIHSSFM